MLFRKISVPANAHNKEVIESWYMILRDMSDVMKYMEMDAELYAEAMIALPSQIRKSHLEKGRATVINNALQQAILAMPENEKIWPHEVVSKIVQSKFRAMCKLLQHGDIQVNQGGGYCSHDSFLKTWNANVVEEVDKQNSFFPTDDAIVDSAILFLENAERVSIDFERNINDLVGYDVNTWKHEKKQKTKITQLKFRDPKWVMNMISNAKTIAIQTQVINGAQIEEFMYLFSQLKDKTIYISTSAKEEITGHRMYKMCEAQHTIIFV